MSNPLQILQKYWKHNTFREPQEAVIQLVLDGNDTFALLPTGGGKSVCYQVPALMLGGITLVVSPLIALIKDQVENLNKKDIKAIALLGGISQDETSNLLDNAQFGNYRFIYISPERLQQEWIVERIKQLPIKLIAIDEAHCVSQWGHDFRPSYLKIKNLKTDFPNVPFLALTASATERVQQDITEHLALRNPQVFKKSFYRENLAYHVIDTEDKLNKIRQILLKNPQSSIIYVRTRKATTDTARQLQALGFTAVYYHGGMSQKDKETAQKKWTQNEVQVIVATNAFGMGIDKPDVKTVIHSELPENLENYYQEAGRAGRNGAVAFGILITHKTGIERSKILFESNTITKDFLKDVYKKLNNYFQIAYGEGFNKQFSFSLYQFCSRYSFPIQKTFNALQFLDNQGIITLLNESSEKVKMQFVISGKEAIRYASLHPADAEIITVILRTYTGIFETEIAVNIALIAKKSQTNESDVIKVLQRLEQAEAILLQLNTSDSFITFNEAREDDRTINRTAKHLENRNKVKKYQFESIIKYAEDTETCKNQLLLRYFDEENPLECGNCSTCISRKKIDFQKISAQILQLIAEKPHTSKELEHKLALTDEQLIFALRLLLEKNAVQINTNKQYYST